MIRRGGGHDRLNGVMWRRNMILLAGLLSGCAAQATRPSSSPLACMRAEVQALPQGLSDDEKHCVASGLITRHCSSVEAWVAGAGKELQDAFTGGDASWADWRSDGRGRQCGRTAADDQAVLACCRTKQQ